MKKLGADELKIWPDAQAIVHVEVEQAYQNCSARTVLPFILKCMLNFKSNLKQNLELGIGLGSVGKFPHIVLLQLGLGQWLCRGAPWPQCPGQWM